MGNFRPLDTSCWEKFLTFMGFSLNRKSSSHHQWTRNGFRTIPVWGNEKQIPPFHLMRGCESMNTTLEVLYAWANKNC